MKKKILSIITVLLMIAVLLSLTACGDSDEKAKKEEEKASSPEECVEQFLGYVEKGKFSKAAKLVDWTLTYKTYDEGYYSYYDELDYEEIEDMSSKELKEYKEDHESSIEYAETAFKDYQETVKYMASFKIDADIKKAKKVEDTKNIYLVKADVEMIWKQDKKDDEDTESDDIEFYVMKDGGEYKIINGVYDVRYMLSDVKW